MSTTAVPPAEDGLAVAPVVQVRGASKSKGGRTGSARGKPAKGGNGLIVAGAVGVGLLVIGIAVAMLASGGKSDQAKKDDPPAKKDEPKPSKVDPTPEPKPKPKVDPKVEPPVVPPDPN